MNNERNIPLKMKVSFGLSLLPLLLWPLAVSRYGFDRHDTASVLLMLLPLFAAAALYLAAKCHSERPHISWLLIAMLWLSYIAVALLIILA